MCTVARLQDPNDEINKVVECNTVDEFLASTSIKNTILCGHCNKKRLHSHLYIIEDDTLYYPVGCSHLLYDMTYGCDSCATIIDGKICCGRCINKKTGCSFDLDSEDEDEDEDEKYDEK